MLSLQAILHRCLNLQSQTTFELSALKVTSCNEHYEAASENISFVKRSWSARSVTAGVLYLYARVSLSTVECACTNMKIPKALFPSIQATSYQRA
jgi:hypothetical protein